MIRDHENDALATNARSYESGWRSGYLEGAIGVLAALAPGGELGPDLVARVAELARRFGVASVRGESRGRGRFTASVDAVIASMPPGGPTR